MLAATRASLKISLGQRVQLESCLSLVSLALKPFCISAHPLRSSSASVHTCRERVSASGILRNTTESVSLCSPKGANMLSHYGNVGLFWHLPSLRGSWIASCLQLKWACFVLIILIRTAIIDGLLSVRFFSYIHTLHWPAVGNGEPAGLGLGKNYRFFYFISSFYAHNLSLCQRYMMELTMRAVSF